MPYNTFQESLKRFLNGFPKNSIMNSFHKYIFKYFNKTVTMELCKMEFLSKPTGSNSI